MGKRKMCELCGQKPATVPDRERMGRLINRVCSDCHAGRLRGDLERIMAARVERPDADVVSHTPGPWNLATLTKCTGGYPDSLAVYAGEMGERGPAICCVSPLDAVTEQDEANAYLIAASPELYRALSQLVTAVAENAVQTRHITNARKALERADGNDDAAESRAPKSMDIAAHIEHQDATLERHGYR